jgi:GxxExxY protein
MQKQFMTSCVSLDENALAGIIVEICFEIHTQMGPGCLESVYEKIICYELGFATSILKDKRPFPLFGSRSKWI